MRNLTLDIGNVLCHIDFTSFINCLSKNLNVTREEVWYFLSRAQKLHDLGLTKMEDDLKDHFKIRSPVIIEELIESWNHSLKPNFHIINGVQELSEELEIEIALLSNIGVEHASWFNQNIKMNKTIKHFSCFVGARKPTILYYQSFLQRYPQFTGSIYVDDNRDNLSTGTEIGFSSHYFNLEEKYPMMKEKGIQSEESADIIMFIELASIIKENL
jgi:FMN phosphatase YigB (HAD superfamily)